MVFGRGVFSGPELAEQLVMEGLGRPFLLYRDAERVQRLLELEAERVSVGREVGNELQLGWDQQASRVHALLERVGGRWTVTDDQLSRNGTFVNGTRVAGRRRLEDRDVIRFGSTPVLFRDPSEQAGETAPARDAGKAVEISPAQHRVLVALCRPLAQTNSSSPPSNREIAAELTVSVEAVRSHLKTLFRLFEVPELPQNAKRAELANRAMASRVLSPRDFTS